MNIESPTTLADINTVKRQTGFKSTQTIYSKMRCEGFPRPILVGTRTKRWVSAEVEAWVQERIAASRQGQEGAQ